MNATTKTGLASLLNGAAYLLFVLLHLVKYLLASIHLMRIANISEWLKYLPVAMVAAQNRAI